MLVLDAEQLATTTDRASWDWGAGKRVVGNLKQMAEGFATILEARPSPDGEKLALVLEREPDKLQIRANGELFDTELEKAWHLRFFPDGRPWALVRVDDEWTVMVGGELWPERWEFAWNPMLSGDGRSLGVQIKRDMEYSIAVNGKPWESSFLSIREYALSHDGSRVAAAAQLEELPEADIDKFLEGTWSLVVDGDAWAKRYLNAYAPIFSADGQTVAAEVRTGATEYTVATDDDPWEKTFGAIWEPRFRRNQVLIPARVAGGWTLIEDGKPIWKGPYVQLWHHALNPDGSSIAAVVATSYGRWTIAVDDVPWEVSFSDMVGPPRWSSRGDRVAVLTKNDDRWGIAVDGVPWHDTWEMAWDPVFGPDGSAVAAKVERGGELTYVINGRVWGESFTRLWDPIFSPDGKALLARGVQDDAYVRRVVPLSELMAQEARHV